MAKHPAVEHVIQFFEFEHLPEPLRSMSAEFAGSGSTGVAAVTEGFDFVGVERDAAHVETARRRIAEASVARFLDPSAVS